MLSFIIRHGETKAIEYGLSQRMSFRCGSLSFQGNRYQKNKKGEIEV